jgi:asparagine synthase (glutamine-hydrolysing)
MLGELAHRGPDALNLQSTDRWAMGIARLSIIDLANNDNVFSAAGGKITFVVNGEIFNYKELRDELRARGYRFRSQCDSEVVGFLYEAYGMDFVNRMNGQFAIALLDERVGRLILVRDPFGILPLFYVFDGKRCAFTSEIRGFRALPDVPRRFDPKALDQLFTFWTTTGKTTFLQDVHQVRPAHYVEIDAHGLRERRYYDLDLLPERIDRTIGFDDARERVRSLLTEAVRIRLESADVEVGTYLSGGVDSSIITRVCERLKPGALQTFSIDFTDPLYAEGKYQEDFLAQTRVVSHRVGVTHKDIVDYFVETIDHAGQPIFRTAPVPLFLLSELVREHGIKVVLTGEGADEVFWGYDIFKELKIRKFWARQPASRRRPLLFKKLYPQFPQFDEKYHTFIASFYQRDLLAEDPWFYSHLVRWRNGASLKTLFSEETRSALAGYDALEDLRSQLPRDFGRFTDGGKCQYLEMQTLLPSYLLSAQGDRMSSAHSVESRIPYLDRRVVEFCASLPDRFKVRSLTDKYILREAFKDVLPDTIYARSKFAYQAPEAAAFAPYAKGAYVEHFLSEDVTRAIGIFDPRRVRVLWNKLQRFQDAARMSTVDNLAFVQVLSTHLFHAQFVAPVLAGRPA